MRPFSKVEIRIVLCLTHPHPHPQANKRNEDEFDRVENKRQRLIRFPIIPNIHIDKPA